MSRNIRLVSLLTLVALLIVFARAAVCAGYWPMFRHDPSHTGRSDDMEGPATPDVVWSAPLGGPCSSSPVVANERIYVTAGGYLRAFDKDGEQAWSVTCPTLGKSSPAVGTNGQLYVAVSVSQSSAYLCAYSEGGALLWKKPLPAPTEASPTISLDGSTLYIGCSNGDFCVYDTSNGERKYLPYRAGGAIASTAALDSLGNAYFGCDDGCVYSLSQKWQLKWKFLTYQPSSGKVYPVKSSPVVAPDGTVYIATMSNCVQAISSSGTSGRRFFTGSEVVSSPAMGKDGSLYFGCRDKWFYSIDSQCALRWKYEVGQQIDSSPAVDSRGIIYVGANNGSVYSFHPNGDLIWSKYLSGSIVSSAAIGDTSSLYVCSTDGSLHAFGRVLTPPSIPIVTDDGTYSTSPCTLHARWSAVDQRSGIARYEYAIGTTVGGEDMVPFTDAGIAAEIIRNDLVLENGAKYYFSVRATNNSGLVSDIGVSDGITVDFTPPVSPLVVDDGVYTGSGDALHFVYSSGDTESGVEHYEYSIGTAAGQQDLWGWTNAGLVKEQTITGLDLPHGKTCYANIRAFNWAGLMSEGRSNGILVDLTAPVVDSVSPTMTSAEIRVKVTSTDLESGVKEVQCVLLESPQLPASPNWVTGLPGSDIVIPGPFSAAKTYYVATRVKNGVDKWSDVVVSAGIHLDNTPPSTPVVVDDGAFQCDNGRIHASWSSADVESGVKSYAYCVGTMPGLANLINWTETTETSATRSSLILTSSGTYYFTVRSVNGVGLASANGYSDGITIDITPPAKPSVTDDGDATSASDSLHASWTAADLESGISDYSYCVGTSPGAADVAPWTLSNAKNGVTAYGLNLDLSKTYYFSVKARNGGGCWSEVASSDGIRYLPGASAWPKFRGDIRNSGCSKLNACITGRVRWQVWVQGYVESSPAVSSDGTIYIGAGDGRLYAINSNATIRWTFQTGGCIESSPAIGSDSSIYVGSHDGSLYCVYPNGTLKWKFEAGGMIWSSPAVGVDGTIYFGCQDGCLYALYPDGKPKWKYKSGGAIWSSPAIAEDGAIYFGCGDSKFYAVKPDGTLKWTYSTGSAIDSSPAIDRSGSVYFGSGDGNFYALNPSGALKWKYLTGRVTDSSPVITPNDRVCFGTGAIGTTGEFYALTLGGQLVWKRNMPGGVRSSPVSAADGTMYVGSADGTVLALAPDGTTVWSYRTGQSILGSSAIASDGSVIVGSDDGKVYSFRDFGGVDITGPSVPKVRATKPYITQDTPISASWAATDLESGVQGYSYAVGTSPGSDNVAAWTYVGSNTSVKRTGLPLQLARTYYVSVVASNYASLQSPVGVSSGITVVSGNPLNTIGATKKRAEGTRVYLPGKVISAGFGDCFFIEEVDRSAGIRCLGNAAGLVPGSVVNVLGTVTLRNGEVILADLAVEPCGFSADVSPLAVNGRTLTAGNSASSGLLLRVAGKVKSAGNDRMVISDGSKDVTVLLQGQKPGIGACVVVTGILCIELVDSKPTTIFKPEGSNSIQSY